MHVPTITVPVPRSGCNMIKPNAKNTKPKDGSIPFLKEVISFCRSDKNLAKKAIIASFMNSEGWTEKAPTPIQLLEPFLAIPIPGTSTASNIMKQMMIRILAHVRHVQ
jgi:hypothetical protein